MINEESRVMLFPHTVSRTGADVLMVARNWFDFFNANELKSVKEQLDSGSHEVALNAQPISAAPRVPDEMYICRMKDGYLIMDSTRTPRTIQVLASKLWDIL